ncbi:MAG: hypothetical protein HY051_02890 [Candidatus Aenigmarchaeota archaeon]|nr:hypothetical protein [Candidatus Aenigmarchaeota archaeon]
MTELKVTLEHEGDQSLATVARPLVSLSQLYYFLWLVDHGKRENWDAWLQGFREWIGEDGLKLKTFHYGSICEATLEVKKENESTARRLAEAAMKVVERLRDIGQKPEQQRREQISDQVVIQLLPEIDKVPNDLRSPVIGQLRFTLFGLSRIKLMGFEIGE